MFNVSGPISFALRTRDGFFPLGTIAASGSNLAPVDTTIQTLPLARAPDRNRAVRLTLVMRCHGHGGDDFWAFNDRSGMPEAPWYRFARGETALITLRNDTAFPHGIHLHGHHFHEVWDDGALGHYRDTTLVDRRVNRDILCVFNNPGKWLLHCHMLGHQESGMRTWVEVA